MSVMVLPIVVVLGYVLPAQAQTDVWSTVNGPDGGTIVWDLEALADGTLLAAASNGVHRSHDQGLTWERFSNGLTGLDVRDIHVDASGTVRVATYGQGLFSLSRQTMTWIPAGLESTFALSLLEPEPGLFLAGVNGDLYGSVDGGVTWSLRSLQGFNASVYSLAANETHIFAGTNIGVFRSADTGQTWEFTSNGLQEYNVRSIDTNDSGHVFAGVKPVFGGCSVYRSRGNGNFWTCVQPDTDPLTAALVRAGEGGNLSVGGFQNLFRSTDEGDTWQVHRVSASNVQALLSVGSALLVGTLGQGVVRSNDNLVTWQLSNTGLQSDVTRIRSQPDGSVVVTTTGGLFITRDLGLSWERIHPDQPLVRRTTDIVMDSEGHFLAATNAGVWRHDAATGWSLLGPPGSPYVRDLDLGADGTLVAGFYAGVWIYANGTWRDAPIVDDDGNARDIVAVHRSEDGSILAGAAWDSWRLGPGASDWQLMSAGNPAWFDVQAFGGSEGRILAGTRFAGVLQSLDHGLTWAGLGSGLGGREDIRDIDVDAQGTPYLATYGDGVFRLDPGDLTWAPVVSGLEGFMRVTTVAHDDLGYIWAGTVDGGLFRRQAAAVSTQEYPASPSMLTLGAPWPNPSVGSFSISLSLPESALVTSQLFDVLGREVLRTETILPAGMSEIRLNPSIQVSGLFWVRVSAGAGSAQRAILLRR